MTRNDTMISLAVNSWMNDGRLVWPDADLGGADLSGADLTGCDLHYADLSGADLSGAMVTVGHRIFTLAEETAR